MRRSPLLLLAGTFALAIPLVACGGDDEPTGPSASDCVQGDPLRVGAKDNLRFDAECYSATAGEIDIQYVNEGSVAHTLLIRNVDDFKLAVGKTDAGSVELQAGTYEMYCDVAGHSAMKATFRVE